jgi:hypothetical protein
MANSRITKKPKVARQYEISQAHIEDNSVSVDPGGLPDMPFEGLPPDNRPHISRAQEISKNDDDSTAGFYLGLEAIDEAIFYYFENVIKPSVLSNGDLVDVPIIYGSGERWKLAQKDGFYRDKGGKVQAPLVMIKRESIEKRRDLGNKLDANNPQLYVTYQEKFTNRNQYDNFALLNNRTPQKEFTATVVPDYVNLTYQGIIWTDYISQLNKVIEAINYASDSYWGDSERFKFMAMIDQFSNINELTTDDSRIVRASFTLKLQGYIIPDNIQKKLREQNTRFFSKSQIVLNNSTTVIEDTLSKRAKQLQRAPIAKTSVVAGGTSTTSNNESTTQDQDWLILDNKLINRDNRDVEIQNASLSVDIGSIKPGDIFLVKDGDSTKLKVDNDGILSLGQWTNVSFPPSVDGGILYKDNEFYFGL